MNQTMATDDLTDDFSRAVRACAERVLGLVQLDRDSSARAAVRELMLLSLAADDVGRSELAEKARDALAEAWRWRLGHDPADARVRLARVVREMVRDLGRERSRS